MAENLKLLSLYEKHNESSNFQDFLNDWRLTEECSIYKWCAKQEVDTLGEALERFYPLLEKQPEVARVVHYHIGFIVSKAIRERWFDCVLSNPVEAAQMYLNDETLTAAQDKKLLALINDEINGAPSYAEAIASGELKRVKTVKEKWNKDSEIVQGIANA